MWYVVQTVAGREFAVCRLIESLVEDDVLQECFVPRYEVQKQFRGQWRTCTATLFPGYLIVVTDRVDELESQLRRVPAFAWVLSNDGGFVPLERDEVAWIDAFTEKGHRTVGVSEGVIEGDRIIVLKGPLVGREGWIRKINRRKRTAYLEIDMFGRTMQTKIGLGIVRKRT
ncbi:antiterminator LoaP [Eggerthella lenta]|uniref:antiterminator LoaP n=1 Tax=Eggerthella lenta TaxID=84112 RepID=UPI002F964A3F